MLIKPDSWLLDGRKLLICQGNGWSFCVVISDSTHQLQLVRLFVNVFSALCNVHVSPRSLSIPKFHRKSGLDIRHVLLCLLNEKVTPSGVTKNILFKCVESDTSTN